MIELSPNSAFMIYLCLTLVMLLSIWGYQHFSTKRSPHITPQNHLCVCEYCHFAYLADTSQTISPCPQCKALNKNNSYKGGKGGVAPFEPPQKGP